MSSGIQVALIVYSRMLMGLEMSCWIERKNMMLMIELMSKNLAVKRPAKCVRHHSDEQYKHDGVDMAAWVHGFLDSIPGNE